MSQKEQEQQQQQQQEENPLTKVTFCAKILKFAVTSQKQLAEISFVNSQFNEAAISFSVGVMKNLQAQQTTEEYNNSFFRGCEKGTTSLVGAYFTNSFDATTASCPQQNGMKGIHFAAKGNCEGVILELLALCEQRHLFQEEKEQEQQQQQQNNNEKKELTKTQRAFLHLLDNDLNTALHTAVMFNADKMISLLIDLGIDPLVRNVWGRTPMHVCVQNSNITAIDCLVKAVEKNSNSEASKKSAATSASSSSSSTSESTTTSNNNNNIRATPQQLLNAKDRMSCTVLHVATTLKATEQSLATLKKLLELGADPAIGDVAGFTPLHFACETGASCFEAFKILFVYMGFDKSMSLATKDGITTLHILAGSGQIEMLDFVTSQKDFAPEKMKGLLEKKTTSESLTVIRYAQARHQKKAVKYLEKFLEIKN